MSTKTKMIAMALLAMLSVTVSAQNQTQEYSLYDQKRYELAAQTVEKTLKLMTVQEVQSFTRMYSMAMSKISSKQEETKCLETFINGFANNTPKDYRAKQFAQAFAPIYSDYKKQLASLEKNKNSLMKQPSSWASSLGVEQWTIGTVEKEVANKFKKWAAKGEFEKSENYRNRISAKGQHVFDSICKTVCSSTWKNDTKIRLLEYDADKEAFNVSISRKDKKMNTEAGIIGNLPVPFDEAENTKYLINEGYAITYEEQGLLIYNGQLFPTSFRMKRFGGLDVIVNTNLTEGEKVRVCYDDLKIGLTDVDEILGGYCYDHNDYLVKMRIEEERIRQEKQRQMEEEQRRKDSIQQEQKCQEEERQRQKVHQEKIYKIARNAFDYSMRFVKQKKYYDYSIKKLEIKKGMAKGVIKKTEELENGDVVFTLKNNTTLPPIKFPSNNINGGVQVSDDEKSFLITMTLKGYEGSKRMLLIKKDDGEMDMYYFLDE